MSPRQFRGREVAKVLTSNGFRVVNREGSHVKLRYEHPERDDDVRVVTVPMHDEIRESTLRSIAEQAGAEDFDSFCRWIDEHR
jgi:predicted RNA binding protein YcfA (HicA-like mRNA interferase family)